ncbi:MAG: UDP-N-acetylmuramoylalanyl-D-glutamyl-2,6-diaminopimelate--D-alanyl-D-alanine ligase [Beijerinckiaceae bacterium]|nr:MAG: UDP-N-acetylmuramoylalanyl-D-glutamyl-2,6-diaminopimelate--D-alanyl-D-alanine ligase [Beijerinckiaceae bacterium]
MRPELSQEQASPEPLWTNLGLIGPLEARVSYGLPRSSTGISIDTRTLAEGDLFFAIRGDKSDGHDHVAAALEKGAAAAVVSEARADSLAGLGPLYVVHEVLPALERLAAAARARTGARIVAVTGSVGKTSTKEALRLVLGEAGAVHASVASYNNHWGVPLTLARMPRQTQFGVIEIGMNHAGEITPLVAMAQPHVAIITTVAPVHLEFFPNVEAIADAKAEIFSGLVPGGIAILNRDGEHFDRLSAAARASQAGHIATFGADAHADARLIEAKLADDSTEVTAEILGEPISYQIGAPGRHIALNSLAVLLSAKAFGLDLEAAARALSRFEAPEGRGRRFMLETAQGPFTLIDESYNANPASVRAALALAGGLPMHGVYGRRIAVLGDMRELGERSNELHAELAAEVESNRIDLVFAAGPMMKHLFDALPAAIRGGWRDTPAELAPIVTDMVRAGDIVVVKGSNASRMSLIVSALISRYAGVAAAS